VYGCLNKRRVEIESKTAESTREEKGRICVFLCQIFVSVLQCVAVCCSVLQCMYRYMGR